jgi:hypothetical protein
MTDCQLPRLMSRLVPDGGTKRKTSNQSGIRPPRLRHATASFRLIMRRSPDPTAGSSAGIPSRPAKVIGQHRLWRREDVEQWRDAKPQVWAPAA